MADEFNDVTSKLLVSLVVPAYNVEQYIEKCLSSILKQTHTNIEVIVVNDGSTDNTGKLIDNISQQDSRVRVIHNKNAGVSAARNSGIQLSTGDYLVFVDADDFIAQDYVEYMLSLVNNTGAEFCLSKHCYTKSGEKQTEHEYIKKLTPEEATALLLSPSVIVGCWNKIFKRSLIVNNNIWFSTNLFYGEGLSFITTVSQKSKVIAVGNRKVYFYRRNNESSATTKFSVEKLKNGERALKIIRENMTVVNDSVDTMYALHMALFSLGALVRIRANLQEYNLDDEYKYWKRLLQSNTKKIMFKKEVSVYRKLMLLCGYVSPWVMMKLDGFRRRKIIENSIEV